MTNTTTLVVYLISITLAAFGGYQFHDYQEKRAAKAFFDMNAQAAKSFFDMTDNNKLAGKQAK